MNRLPSVKPDVIVVNCEIEFSNVDTKILNFIVYN